MANLTSIENVILNNSNLSTHPKLEQMIQIYALELSQGYEPDAALLTGMFLALQEVVATDPALVQEITSLEILIAEDIMLRDPALAENPALGALLAFYVDALEAGYEPSDETQSGLVAVLSDLDITDGGLADLIDSVIDAVAPLPPTFGATFSMAWRALAGYSVAGAGDVNGDGIGDFLIGAPMSGELPGSVFVIYGNATGFDASVDLSALDGRGGFVIEGIEPSGYFGLEVSPAGDLNADGIDDILIRNLGNSAETAGNAYVVFGAAGASYASIDASQLDGVSGFTVTGFLETSSFSREIIDSLGDINGDGIDDMIIGSESHPSSPGRVAAVIFGTASGFLSEFDIGSLDGSNGFLLINNESDVANVSSAGIGDFNGDGLNDLLIAGNFVLGEQSFSYVVFGTTSGFHATVDLAELDGSDGFPMSEASLGGVVGKVVSAAGDLNGDGYDDIILANPDIDDSRGKVAVVFGTAADLSGGLGPSGLDGTAGFSITGLSVGDRLGASVAGIGDVNSDGVDDIAVSVAAQGEVYVIFGKTSGWTASLDLATLDGSNGYVLHFTGTGTVGAAGDANGDGHDDFLIGTPTKNIFSGEVSLVYGGPDMLQRFDAADGVQDGRLALSNIGLDPASVDALVFA